MLLQIKSQFDLDLGAKVTQNVALFPLNYVTYAPIRLILPWTTVYTNIQ